MKSSYPGAFLREEILEALGLSVACVAEVLGLRRATLSGLVNGNERSGSRSERNGSGRLERAASGGVSKGEGASSPRLNGRSAGVSGCVGRG